MEYSSYTTEALIDALVEDYYSYLGDLEDEELVLIIKSGYFLLREAKKDR